MVCGTQTVLDVPLVEPHEICLSDQPQLRGPLEQQFLEVGQLCLLGGGEFHVKQDINVVMGRVSRETYPRTDLALPADDHPTLGVFALA
jgi:hypothetical protein